LLSVEVSEWRGDTFGSSEFNTLFCPDCCEWICWTDGYGNFTCQAVFMCFIQIYLVLVFRNLARR
jgi:hypothetical protein